MSDLLIAEAVAKTIELRLTSIVHTLYSYQLADETTVLFPEYSGLGLGGHLDYAAAIEEADAETFVDCRISLVGENRARMVFAPADYYLILKREFNRTGRGYLPSPSFLVRYLLPQMFCWDDPENWAVDWHFSNLDAKDGKGNYIDLDDLE
jgi:hypothetical protein